ncbi:PiggyBac transposable element-derived protein [Phytophthora cactorum]|nr:PiggyBac transposable element-derived protein [Phytophthora cactorum]
MKPKTYGRSSKKSKIQTACIGGDATPLGTNLDNYYTSVQLLQELRLKGLYGRGTIRANSKHYPAHAILPQAECIRGDYRQALSPDQSILVRRKRRQHGPKCRFH